MFKIAYGAGHNDKTGNGIPTSLHKPFMNEWRLNDRVARYFAEAAAQYEDVRLMRVDDPKGIAPVDLQLRCDAANKWGADFFLSIHHDAGVNGGKGGGMTVYCNTGSIEGRKYQDAVYTECMAAGGLKGRSSPKLEKGFHVLKYTNMPALLVEYGFMDSTTDVPVILTEKYAKDMAYATMAGIAKVKGLKKKAQQPVSGKIYRVQVGAFQNQKNAASLRDELRAKGYKDAFIKEDNA